jgi:hypothetical protein
VVADEVEGEVVAGQALGDLVGAVREDHGGRVTVDPVHGERGALGEAAPQAGGVPGVASFGIGLREVAQRDAVGGGVGHGCTLTTS